MSKIDWQATLKRFIDPAMVKVAWARDKDNVGKRVKHETMGVGVFTDMCYVEDKLADDPTTIRVDLGEDILALPADECKAEDEHGEFTMDLGLPKIRFLDQIDYSGSMHSYKSSIAHYIQLQQHEQLHNAHVKAYEMSRDLFSDMWNDLAPHTIDKAHNMIVFDSHPDMDGKVVQVHHMKRRPSHEGIVLTGAGGFGGDLGCTMSLNSIDSRIREMAEEGAVALQQYPIVAAGNLADWKPERKPKKRGQGYTKPIAGLKRKRK